MTMEMMAKMIFLGVVLVLVHWPPSGQSQTTPSGPRLGKAYTFDMPGVSYLDSTPPLVSKQNIGWRFEFRTKLPNTLLFHHGIGSYNRKDFPGLDDYELYWEIQHGSLHVVHHLNGWQDEVTIGIALSDDRWHRVWVTVDGKTGQATVRLDNQNVQMRPYGLTSAVNVLVWSNLTTVTSFGGTEKPISMGLQTFIGCMQDLKYLSDNGKYKNVQIRGQAGISDGCVDLCSGVNPCRHGGRCVSQYTQTVCDCFGTGYEGSTCQIPGSTVVTLNGYDWIVYRLYDQQEDWVNREKHRFSFEFKTERGAGVLMYAMGTSPTNNHVIATLYGGSVNVAVSFGEENLELNMGIGLDNARWHNLTIHHLGSLVEIHLDGVVRRRRTSETNFYLSLDPNIYFGGGHNFVRTRGLKVTQNFVGCLRNVYVDEVAVLYNINKGSNKTKYSGRNLKLGCDPVKDPPMTFPRSGTMLLLENTEEDRLTVELEFRTVLHEAVLIHSQLIAPDKNVGYDIGDLEVWISNGEVMLHYKPSSRYSNFTQDIGLGEKVNDAHWHRLILRYLNRQVWLQLDGKQVISEKYVHNLRHQGNVVIGHGLRRYKNGFVGCMRSLKVQGRTIDPLVMVESKQSVGVVLDGCNLKDRCRGLELCEHQSTCVSDWEGVICDCSRVAYTGKTCHFANYLRTCDEYYQAGWRGSGVYRVDPDGNGPLTPIYVNCDMDHMVEQEGYGLTVIQHNLPKNFTAREIGESGRKVKVSYRGVDRFTLEALTSRSLKCRQHISYICKGAKLGLGKLTWFKSTSGHIVDYLGTTKPGDCHCAENNHTCIEPDSSCNCDSDVLQWTEDQGYNTIKDELPISDMTFRKDEGESVISLGPLECWGNADHRWDMAVTMKTPESYLSTPPWKSGDLEISFKTDKSSATFLHQSSPQTSRDFLTMTLLDDNKLEISYSVGGVERRVLLQTMASFSNGLWNQVRIEHDKGNARFTLNEASKMVKLRRGERLGGFDGVMYVGSPGPKLAGSEDGIIGCIRGLVYNGMLMDLGQYSKDKRGIEAGCTASCQSSPCQHGATCDEKWGKYTCHCENTWSHLGSNCQQNIDENVATIDGDNDSYLEVNITSPTVLSGTMVFSFRTFQANAMLFYMYDQYNNFIQLELRNAREILLLFNSLTYIIQEFIQVSDLNDGSWKQVIIERLDSGWIKLQCGKDSRVIQQKHTPLKTYLQSPFTTTESVLPIRTVRPPEKPFVKLYVGGVPKDFKTETTAATLHGCVRGFRSDGYIFDLEASALHQNGTSGGCMAGCERQGCQNGGLCLEQWEGQYKCDCVNSYYSGLTCQTEPSGKFDGNMVVKSLVELQAASLDASTSTERLTLQFTANSTANTERVVLVFVYSSTSGDYILVYLTRVGDVVVETDLGTGTYIVKKSGNFVDDQKHRLEYRRRRTELILTLDQDKPSTVVHPDYTLDNVDTIMVGGVMLNNQRFSNFYNFTGCISDVVYYPRGNRVLKFRPLKELHEIPRPGSVEAWGEEPQPCTPTLPIMEKPQQEIPSSPSDDLSRPEVVTMPPWNKGPPDVVMIVSTKEPAITNHTQIVPVITPSSDFLTIIIAVTLVAFLLIVALVIALLLARLRRRHERYNIEKQPAEYHELKKPLKSNESGKIPRADHLPNSHLATMDEFSLVSGGTLDRGSRESVHEANGYHFPELTAEDEALLNPPLNRKTNRPASSISEVLEEMERRRKAKVAGVDPDVVVLHDSPVSAQSMQMHGEGELEWDPQTDRVPLSSIMDYSDEFSESESSGNPSVTEVQVELTVGDSPKSHHSQKKKGEADASSHHSDSPVRGEFNGDSGYEAGSKPEVEEDHLPSSDKHYKYDIGGYNSESLLKGDSVKTRLISEEAETAC